ncbi:DUF3857 domain-containing protein [uncultured Dokdonia sp.]|uniref:DUF3857 domain-containing protein n=1 Tax=uncultured Dokdonia sp. TaxID=575653 RepID=UPI0026156112|nr:DUF3857 domain-containing protein [uncultured Dokdonia sp.]
MRIPTFLLCMWALFAYSQDNLYTSKNIPEDLLKSANSVLRFEKHTIDIPNSSTIKTAHKRVVTVLNKRGNRDVEAYMYYDDVTRIKNASVVIYDDSGKEVKKYKQRDFKDVSAADGISLYIDTRLLYLDFTPTSYPYTVVVESEIVSKNTASIPSFYANEGYYSSTEEKIFEINYADEVNLKHKMYGDYNRIEVEESQNSLRLVIKNSPSLVPEDYSPGFRNIVGRVAIALNDFHLEGLDGDARDWGTFGQWMNENLLQGAQDLPEETITQAKELVKGIKDPIAKAKIIYDFVQNKTRYISVQVGIGGWKPMLASQVDKLGYGDCKALTNYTKSLLEAVGVPSYYTILYGSRDKRDIEDDFTAIQGNHAILSVPTGDDYVWLECTDQEVPFGFIAGFTDDRDVLVVKPDGGEIVHTKKYTAQDNYQIMNGSFTIDASGNAQGGVSIKSGGLQYAGKYRLVAENQDDKKKYYYKFWNYLNNVSLTNINILNNRDEAITTENIELEVENYASFAGDEMLVSLNLFNRYTALPDRVKNRMFEVEISRGFKDEETIEINLPDGFEVVSVPKGEQLKSPFGTYSYSIKEVENSKIIYKRSFIFNEGTYSKENYAKLRSFIRSVIRNDQQKIVIKKQ